MSDNIFYRTVNGLATVIFIVIILIFPLIYYVGTFIYFVKKKRDEEKQQREGEVRLSLARLAHELNKNRCTSCNGFGRVEKEGAKATRYRFWYSVNMERCGWKGKEYAKLEPGLTLEMDGRAYEEGYDSAKYILCSACSGRGFFLKVPADIPVDRDTIYR